MKDVKASLDKLANNPAGITDPFESIYRIVYQLTIRMVGCDDIADDPALLEKTLGLYETVEKSTTPLAIIFPWFPSFAIIRRTIAGGRLYMILNNIVEERKKTGKRGTDPLQFLIDQGDSMARIIEVSKCCKRLPLETKQDDSLSLVHFLQVSSIVVSMQHGYSAI
jgi:hypothetical protein